ncbi:unnamed protein product [Lepeophtheirus salmonis]|uniref:(salmon louse) hypothetical protein n=1 Tax=Lepeophtheirus salmonis TaxID=72036 RepID=A0A7R8GZ51_LEPSM|nr:unnamed protein product [Lepeophtheirus salmonis]CAF2757999.1 unnamed protein product [Lepeophtheirus salmonis]
MPIFCFDVLSSKLNGGISPPKEPNFSNDSSSVFVKWTKDLENRKLHGFIGTFSKLKFRKGIREYTLMKGLEDYRFGSILLEEIPHLIKIEFRDKSEMERLATYLPEISRFIEWHNIKPIDKLLKKGGWKSEVTPELRNSIKLVSL